MLDRNLLWTSAASWAGSECSQHTKSRRSTSPTTSRAKFRTTLHGGRPTRSARNGIKLKCRLGSWVEVCRVFKACTFVEDEDDILHKNPYGFAATMPVFMDHTANNSGLEVVDKDV